MHGFLTTRKKQKETFLKVFCCYLWAIFFDCFLIFFLQVFNEQTFAIVQGRIQALILEKENEWAESNKKVLLWHFSEVWGCCSFTLQPLGYYNFLYFLILKAV